MLAHQPPQIARANGIDICYEIFGDPAAEPLLLIMGLGAQMIHWDDDFCRQLAARGFRVIRFDNRDIGKSSHLSGGKRLTAVELLKLRLLKSILSTTGNPKLPQATREAAAMLMAPPPKTKEEYFARFAQTWKVLRVGSFPEDEARDRSRAERTFDRRLDPRRQAPDDRRHGPRAADPDVAADHRCDRQACPRSVGEGGIG